VRARARAPTHVLGSDPRENSGLRSRVLGLLLRAPERPCQAKDHPRIGALHGPIVRLPGIVGRDQPDVVEVGILGRLADIGTECGVAVLDHVPRECVVGRVTALAHRPEVEELELVLGRARDRLDVLDLVGGRLLEVETVPDAQVDAVVDVDLIPVEVSRLVDLVGRRRPQCGPESAPQVRPRARRSPIGLLQVPAGDGAHQHERAGDQPVGRDPSPKGPGVGGIGRPRRRRPARDVTVGWRRHGVGRRPVGVDATVRRRLHSLLRPRLRLGLRERLSR
jgi:hypothetical protein